MDTMFKYFNIEGSSYIFCVEDFEILKIANEGSIETVIQDIKNEKYKSKLDFEEIQKNNSDFTKDDFISTIGIDLVNGCNLDCTYCFISASSKKRKILKKDVFLDILNFLKNEKDNAITFFFAGAGEPTLNFELMKQLPNLCVEYTFKNVAFDLTTNGTILTPEIITFLKEYKFDINISLDGNEEINDLNRRYSNLRGSFKDVFSNIKLLQDSGIEFSCKTVLTPSNKKIIDVFSFFEENKIKFVFTVATNSFDNHFMPNIEDLDCFENQMDLVVEKYVELIKNNNVIFSKKILSDIKRVHYGDIKAIACGGSRDGFYVDIDGDIFPCSYHTSTKELSVGNIYKGIDYNKIAERKWYAQPVVNYASCRSCWMKYLCSGSCFAIKWLENQNTEEPSQYLCSTYNIYWSAIIKLYIRIYPHIIDGNNVNFNDIVDERQKK